MSKPRSTPSETAASDGKLPIPDFAPLASGTAGQLIANWLTPTKDAIKGWQFWALVALAWGLGVAVRLAWPMGEVGSQAGLQWNGTPILTTADAFFFGSAAQGIADGLHSDNLRLAGAIHREFLSHLMAGLKGILPYSLDAIAFYLPVFMAPLIAVPMALIGRALDRSRLGILAGAFTAVAYSYYTRSHAGYADTDLIALTIPLFAVPAFIGFAKGFELRWLLAAAAVLVVYPATYRHGYPLVSVTSAAAAAWLIVFERKRDEAWMAVALLAVTFVKAALIIKLPALAILYLALTRLKIPRKALIWGSLGLILAGLIGSRAIDMILQKSQTYTGERSVGGGGQWKFLDTTRYVTEAQRPGFDKLAERFAGYPGVFVVAIIGYAALLLRFRVLMVTAAFAGVGAFAFLGGLRFTVYGVPMVGLGLAMAVCLVTDRLPTRRLQAIGFAALGLLMLFHPGDKAPVWYAANRPLRPAIFPDEIKVLDAVSKTAKPGDYTVAWWDFGYPIWYYAHTSTLIDGGKHGKDNFLVAKILAGRSQRQAANLSRLTVETLSARKDGWRPVVTDLFKAAKKDGQTPKQLMKSLANKGWEGPEATRDIYLYLPERALRILQTIEMFQNVDLATGNPNPARKLRMFNRYKAAKNGDLLLGKSWRFLAKEMAIQTSRGKVRLKAVHVATLQKDGSVKVQHQRAKDPSDPNRTKKDKATDMHLVVMPHRRSAALMDRRLLKSNFVQMFIFDNYDKSLWEPVVRRPMGAVFRLKRTQK